MRKEFLEKKEMALWVIFFPFSKIIIWNDKNVINSNPEITRIQSR